MPGSFHCFTQVVIDVYFVLQPVIKDCHEPEVRMFAKTQTRCFQIFRRENKHTKIMPVEGSNH